MLAITGVTGRVGRHVLRQLLSMGRSDLVILRRDPSDCATPNGITVRQTDFAEPQSTEAALSGVTTLFLVCGASPLQPRLEETAVSAAKRQGVAKIVKLSAIEASVSHASDYKRWNGLAEAAVVASGIEHVMVRPTSFMQNLGTAIKTAFDSGQIISPVHAMPISFVDVRDVARVVCHALTQETPAGAIFDVTGPESLTYSVIAERLSTRLGKPVIVREESDAEMWLRFRGAGMSVQDSHSLLTHFQAYRTRPSTLVTDWVRILTGEEPVRFDKFLAEFMNHRMSGNGS